MGFERALNSIRKIGFECTLNSNRKMGYERTLKPKVWLRILTSSVLETENLVHFIVKKTNKTIVLKSFVHKCQ